MTIEQLRRYHDLREALIRFRVSLVRYEAIKEAAIGVRLETSPAVKLQLLELARQGVTL